MFRLHTLAHPDDTAALLARLRTIQPDSPRQWGRMTPHQMLCHLADSHRVALGERAASEAAPPIPRAMMKVIALYLPLPWPRNIETRPEVDQTKGGTHPSEFAADLVQVVQLTETLATRPERLARSHPIFGPMSVAAWQRWAYLHVDHHLRQFGV